MAAINDCTADRAEATWTQLELDLQADRPPSAGEITCALAGIQTMTLIAIAHALEGIAKGMETIDETLATIHDRIAEVSTIK